MHRVLTARADYRKNYPRELGTPVRVRNNPYDRRVVGGINTSAPTFAPGSTFAGYRIEAEAGRGGMGIVYRATQVALGRPVALKLIAADFAGDRSFRERFKREWETAASIDHPNVIPVYEAGEAEEHLFIAMRYVEGLDLANLLAREPEFAPERAVRIIAQVASALDAAHARGLVHRDVKPANVLIGAEEHVYLTDFGLTKHASQDALTKTGLFVGSVDYAAPEQIRGEAMDARTDVYSLGCVLYQALTKRLPVRQARRRGEDVRPRLRAAPAGLRGPPRRLDRVRRRRRQGDGQGARRPLPVRRRPRPRS